jgi:hypothetical protein
MQFHIFSPLTSPILVHSLQDPLPTLPDIENFRVLVYGLREALVVRIEEKVLRIGEQNIIFQSTGRSEREGTLHGG